MMLIISGFWALCKTFARSFKKTYDTIFKRILLISVKYMENLIFIPLGVLLFLFIRMSAKRAVFYKHKSGNKERIDHVRWYHYAIYYLWVLFFAWAIITPFIPEVNEQIVAFYSLHTGRSFVEYIGDTKELGKDLPNGDHYVGYETLRNVSGEELVNEIIPKIIEYQRRFQEWVPKAFGGYDLSGDFRPEYDIENDKFLLWRDGEMVGEILVKNSWFFKKLYFCYYSDAFLK